MVITKTQNENKLVLAISGRLDTITAPQFQEELFLAFNEARQVELDFANVLYISSAGLRVLLLGEKKAMEKNRSMNIINASESIKSIFEMTGFVKILKIV
ncbi:MAG: STAS domain-containing protein [Fibromonadaceae bacterium]|jgi:anti-anti-sigma factor|nr:STAS domain-containing protein [Fibromonadaceae bacterium]